MLKSVAQAVGACVVVTLILTPWLMIAEAGDRPRLTNQPPTTSISGAGGVTSPLTVGTGNFSYLDAGTAMVNGPLHVLGPVTMSGGGSTSTFLHGGLLTNGGDLRPQAGFDNTLDVGTSTLRYRAFHVYTPSVYTAIKLGASQQVVDSATAPTLTACTSPTVTWNTGTAAFQVDVGSTCAGISTAVITLPTATNGWSCHCDSISAPATRTVDASAWSTTSVTITNYSRTLGTAADWADGADVRCSCRGG